MGQGLIPGQRTKIMLAIQHSKKQQQQQKLLFSHSLELMSDSFEPMDCSTPGFPVLHHFPKLAETCVLWVGDAIQPSHPPSSPSRAFSLSQHQIFSNESALHISWPNYWSFSIIISPSNEYSGLISFKINWLDLFQIKELSRIFSNPTVIKHQSAFSMVQLSHPYTDIHTGETIASVI